MDIDSILRSLKEGGTTAGEARRLLSLYAIEHVEGVARLDIARQARRGVPEVVYAESKELRDIRSITERMIERAGAVVISRIKEADYDDVINHAKRLGAEVRTGTNCSTILAYRDPPADTGGRVGILAAGTSDIGVAEEARLVCEAAGCSCRTAYDVGVAGMQRVFPGLRDITEWGAGCIIVVAGMEGALATLVASLADVPVIGVPTSVGYGYGGGGVAALASMLQSCSLGLAAVNIDGGVAAGGIAAGIARQAARAPSK